MARYGFVVRHVAAHDHCIGIVDILPTEEQAKLIEAFMLRWTAYYPRYVIQPIESREQLLALRLEMDAPTRGRRAGYR